jgi:glycosyltransferase involved in cell wall biosynthesis
VKDESGRTQRVCIVTQGQIGSNPRVVKEADTLHAAGYHVSVIATRTLDLVGPRDAALMRRIPWRLERIDLRSRLVWKLRRAGQLCARRAYLMTGLGRSAEAAISAFTPPLRRAALATPANLYIAHYPAALPAVAAAARQHGARYAYDAEDFHLGDWPEDAAHDIERGLVRAVEGRYLPACAYVTAAAPGIADAYAEAYGIEHPRVVLNTFPRTRAGLAPASRGTAQPGPSLYWFSQTIGPTRGLECAVRALERARTRPHLYLRGTAADGYAERLLDLARSAGTAGRVHLLPPDEPDRMEELASAYDVGLCGEPGHTRNNAVALSNKLFTYLLAGLPPLMSGTPGHRRFAEEAGLADLLYSPEDPAALALLLDRLLGDSAELAARREQAWRAGQQRYSWEQEQKHLIDAVGRTHCSAPLNS